MIGIIDHSFTITAYDALHSGLSILIWTTIDFILCPRMSLMSASLSWNKAPIWGLRTHFYYCQTFVGLLLWGDLSDEKKGLSFTIAAGPRQASRFRVRAL
jgi:hypothetical protein